jgi:hypothetical protein
MERDEKKDFILLINALFHYYHHSLVISKANMNQIIHVPSSTLTEVLAEMWVSTQLYVKARLWMS